MSDRHGLPRLAVSAGAALGFLFLAAAACDAGRGDDWQAYDRHGATLRELSRANAAVAPNAGLAGISTYEVPGLIAFRQPAGGVTDSVGYHRFVHRCGACHGAPDPAMHTAAEWPAVLDKMKTNMKDAGLLPLRPEDQRLITRFLIETRRAQTDTASGP